MSQPPVQDDSQQSSSQPSLEPAREPLQFAALMPNHRDLYVLAAGLILGLLLGPAVLGRLSPETYHRYFPDLQVAMEHMAMHNADVAATMQKLVSTDVTSIALEEFAQISQQKSQPYVQAVNEAKLARGRLIAAVIAVLVFMVFETLPEATAILLRSRLATARYALMALTLVLLIAQPFLFSGLSVAFVMLLLGVGLVVALVPLSGKRR